MSAGRCTCLLTKAVCALCVQVASVYESAPHRHATHSFRYRSCVLPAGPVVKPCLRFRIISGHIYLCLVLLSETHCRRFWMLLARVSSGLHHMWHVG